MNQEWIKSSLENLHYFCKKQQFVGYSLYDSHNGFIPFEKFGKTISFYANQVIKRSPVNLRPLIGVKKGINPKGYGLFLHAYSMLARMDVIDKKEAKEKAQFFFEWLKENPSKGYSGHCWGYNYDWPRSDGSMFYSGTPSVVVTGFIIRGMLEYYKLTGNTKVIDIVNSACNFVLNDVYCTETKHGICYSYTPLQRDLVINASLLGTEILTYADYLTGENKYQKQVEDVLSFTLNNQNQDGSWDYSIHPESGKPKKQYDFHQGYVLESIQRIYQYSKREMSENVKSSIKRGLAFYYNKQFDHNGQSYWRIPAKWPVDIHNQSQGIITFSYFSQYSKDYMPFAQKIADWTIRNMQGKKGNFYYQKWPLVTNKVNYLRWNQAWMLLALTTLLKENS